MNQMKTIHDLTPVTTPFPKNTTKIKIPFAFLVKISQKTPTLKNTRLLTTIKSMSSSTTTTSSIESVSGGKMVVELVGTFNELTDRIKVKNNVDALSGSASHLLFNTLKLCLPILQSLPVGLDGRSPLSRALSVALLLADLQMDAQVICAGILMEVVEVGAVTMYQVKDRIGITTAHLLHETFRVINNNNFSNIDDDETASAFRKFCLTYYDVRALILHLALKLDMMRHLEYLPRYQQQMLSLEVMKIHAPLAHAVGTNSLSLQLEDLSFQYLFPYSYLYVNTWLRSHETGIIDDLKEQLLQSLNTDPILTQMVDEISVEGRYKSHYSTMKKLLRDGRKPEEVNDILGLRVILKTSDDDDDDDYQSEKACYRARLIIRSLWKEVPNRSKDYIAKPKANGYKSLHMAVDVSSSGRTRPLMEIQIRTAQMNMLASDGTASHAFYKAGLTNPEQAKRIKTIMIAAAEYAALRLNDFSSANAKGNNGSDSSSDRIFRLLDKNGDGKISIEELTEVMVELGAQGDDAREMMQLLDANSDGSLSSDEFDMFQKQVEVMRGLEDRDDEYKSLLNEKLQGDGGPDGSGLVQVYRKELEDRLSLS